MKLKKEFIAHDTMDESLLVPTGDAEFSGIVRGNKTLGAVLSLLQEETTQEQVVEGMLERFDAPREVVERDVERAITELRKIGALEE